MMNFYEGLPSTICVQDTEYEVITDFREWLRIFDMLKDDDVQLNLKAYFARQMIIEDEAKIKASEMIEALMEFALMKEDKTENKSTEEDEKEPAKRPVVLSYSIDMPYILADFLHYYQIDLIEIEYLHWYKFKMLLEGLSENSQTKQRMYYRSIDLSTIKDKKEKTRIMKIQQSIQLPQEALSDEDIANAFI